MKKFFRYFAAFVLAAGLIGCSDDDADTTGVVDGAQVYFSNETATIYTLANDTNSVSVTLSRVDTDSALDVPVTLTAADPSYASLFRSSGVASFAAGSTTAPYTISFDRDALQDGAAYSLALSIDDATVTTPYGASTLTISVRVPEPLVLLGTGTFREDCMTTFWKVDNVVYDVEIYENTKNPGYIYLKNVYTSLYPYNDPGDYVEEDTYLEVRINPADQVYIPKQYMGLDWGDGPYFLFTAAYGTYDQANGIITFPAKGLAIGYGEEDFEAGSGYYCNNNGMFRITMPGAVLTDYTVEVAYAGIFHSAADEYFAVAEVSGGEDVEYIEVGMAATNDPEAVLEAMMAGEIEVVRVDGNAGSAQLPLDEDGAYTIVAVSYGGGDSQEAASVSFKFYAGTAPELSPLEKDYTFDDMNDLISKSDLFSKTWVLWGVDNDDENGITDRQPFAYVYFSENEELDFEVDGEEYDMINVEGLGLNTTADDTHVWEYYEGVLFNYYMHDNLGQWNGYYINYAPAVVGQGAYGFLDEMMVACVVDEGYMALCYTGFYTLSSPEPNGFHWYAYTDAECTTPAGYLMRMKNIMFQDAEIFAAMAASNAKVSKAKAASTFTSKELQQLTNAMTFRSDYVQTNRGYMRSKIDALKASKQSGKLTAGETIATYRGTVAGGLHEVSADRTFKLTNDTPAAYLR